MRTLSSVGLVLSVLALTACEDSTGVGGIWRSPIGTLNASGNASVELPPNAGNTSNLPALTCYTANPADPPAQSGLGQVLGKVRPFDDGDVPAFPDVVVLLWRGP